jgi:hypothetical protein
MAKKKVQIDKASDFGKYIGKTCITHHTDKGIIVGYTVVFNLFIIGLLEETKYSWNMVQDEYLNYDIIESDDVVLVHSPMFKGYCYDRCVIIEE